jgi:hypothetical protein
MTNIWSPEEGGSSPSIIPTAVAKLISDLINSIITVGNSSKLESKTWEAPGPIGLEIANSGKFTTLSASTVNPALLVKDTGADAANIELVAKIFNFVFAEDYAAVGNGIADDYIPLQKAINAVSNRGGGTVFLTPGAIYKITAGLVAHAPVLLKSFVRGDISSNTNGGGSSTAKPTVLYAGTAGAIMFDLSPSTVGNVIWGGGAEGIEWNGGDLADYGVRLNNTKYAVFDGKVRQVRYAGVAVTSDSGSTTNFSMHNQIKVLEFIWGTADACKNANGLLLRGNGTNVPSTQQYIGYVAGLVYNGALVYTAETDNAHFGCIQASVQSGGTGCAWRVVNVGSQASNHCEATYVNGPIWVAAGVMGPKILTYVSEAGGITGTGTWNGELTDYVTGKIFKGHTYSLRKKVSLSPGDFIGDSGTSTIKLGLQWQTISFVNSGTGRVTAIIPPLYDIDAGVLEGIEVFIGTNGTSAGNYRMQVSCSTCALSTTSGVVTPESTLLNTVAAPSQYQISKYIFTFSSELSIASGDAILLAIDRLAADALDTNSDDSLLVGARVLFKGAGPNSGGSGTYAIPSW